jgi:beta-mannan synthase
MPALSDFVPPEDFLYQTVYHMQRDAKLAFVQGCWTHANRNENWLTWFQAIALDMHFAIEQRARGFMRTFFGFNGTAGVWRVAAMNETGGWSIDTTVEDMDLSTRAFCLGWKFKYLHHVKCPSELPSSMSAFKSQQYRWQSGPMQVAKKCLVDIVTSKRIGIGAKTSASWFFVRCVWPRPRQAVCYSFA